MSRASALVSAITLLSQRIPGDRPEHQVSRSMQGEINRLRMSAEALEKVSRSRSPLDTPAAHAIKVAKLARKLDAERVAAFQRLVKTWGEGREKLQHQIENKLNLKPDPEFANEIRTAFRALSNDEKAKFIEELVTDSKRGPEMAAILRAPSILTGISDEQKAAYELSFTTKHAGDLFDEQKYLDGAYENAIAAERATFDLVKAFTDPQQLAQIEREAAVSREAGEAFDRSLQPQ
jgi:hypothetical protein